MPDVINIDGADGLQDALQGILNDVADQFGDINYATTLKTEVVPLLSETHSDYFDRQGGPLGPWAPLAPATIKAKGFDTILIEHNNMRSSLLFSDATDHIEDISEAGLTWGTSDPKAMFHMEGRPNMPARPFVGLEPPIIDKTADIIADATVEGLKQ